MTERRKYRVVAHVVWDDASWQAHELQPEEIRTKSVRLESAGLLVKETPTHVAIAMDHFPEDSTLRRVENIPRGMIVRLRKFRVNT